MSDVALSLLAEPESPASWRRPFERLDTMLAAAVAAARVRFGAEAANDAFRGLYITDEQATAALQDESSHHEPPAWTAYDDGWAWLRNTYGLTDAELDVVLIALAPEVDPRYERLYGYLQDDVNRRRATVNLILDLISTSPDDKLVRRSLFAADAPLLRNHLIDLVSEDRSHPPLLAQTVVPDEQITDVLLTKTGLDRQLAAFCRLTTTPPPGGELPPAILTAARSRTPLRVQLYGAEGQGAVALALAGELRVPLLTLHAAHVPAADAEAAVIVTRSFREAVLQEALLFIDDVDVLTKRARQALTEGLADHPGTTVMAGTNPWSGGQGLEILDVAVNRADLAARRLSTLARRVEPASGWADLVVPADTTAQLRELCARVGLRSKVLDDWGFGGKRGRGTSALFTGPPGTGKTTAAEVVAGELGLDLFAIDLSTVVSKYIGETEKNLEKIFTAAADADAILLFDEADALFGKRSEVHDAHDRYANVETSYLLQRMEQYEGVAILATNLRQNLDEAFTRRLQFIVEFPFPDEELREGIWRICFPAGAPLAGELDFAGLARDFRLSGANIRNATLHAAYLAAAQGEPIGMPHVRRAIQREFQKLGRVRPELG